MATRPRRKAKPAPVRGARAEARRTSRPKPARPKRKQPETLRLRSATPVFTVSDIEKSLAWYRDVMGFVVRDRWEQGGKLLGVEMLAGAVSFMLTQDDWKKGRDRVKGEGFRIYCTTAQDVDALAREVKAKGATFVREVQDEEGSRGFAVADPDGYKIGIASLTSNRTSGTRRV